MSENSTITTQRDTRSFKLTRFFSGTSLVGILVVTTCLIWSYRGLSERHLIEHESRANADLTRAFANSVWHRYRDFVIDPADRSKEELMADPVVARLRSDVIAQMEGLPVVKIKIYNLNGLTVFSTDESQIGEDKSDNRGFMSAKSGVVASDITYREKFDAFEGTLNKRNLIASYVPVWNEGSAEPESVFEVYSDVTELLKQQSHAQWQIAGIVLALLGTLYFFLFFVVRKADRIIASQELQRAAKENEIRHQAYHDTLTGLPNRAAFSERLEESLSVAIRYNHSGTLLFIDLDRFKSVNDSMGHHVGDLLLKEVSERIRSGLRAGDRLYRMGGDEFTVILPPVADPEDANLVAQRILEAVASPLSLQGQEVVAGATIGLANYPSDGSTTEELLKNADAAMYIAKEYGRGTHAFYQVDMNKQAQQRIELEASLRKGLAEDAFELYYQSRVDSETRQVVSVEALLRWNDPSHVGVREPIEFMSVLEDTGLISKIGQWALRSICWQINDWQNQGLEPIPVSWNVSLSEFERNSFVQSVGDILIETGVSPELLEIEISEIELIDSVEHARTTIAALRELGVRLSIDDFGTGYSSLNYLRQFDVDVLKIDGSFVTQVSKDTRITIVVESIINLATDLGIAVVAEGVETEEQARFFANANCAEMQGYLFCKPLAGKDMDAYLLNNLPNTYSKAG